MKTYISIEELRMHKTDDPQIALYGLLDSTRDLIFKAVDMELAQYQMSAPQVKVLDMLARSSDGLTLSQLSEGTVKELNSVSALVTRMAKKGLVKKTRKLGDGKIYVVIAEAGKEVFENTVTERSIHLVFETLNNAEEKQLRSLLSKLHQKARTLLGLDYKPPFLD
jgi:DNA-binding MarR family transcriptional regulator